MNKDHHAVRFWYWFAHWSSNWCHIALLFAPQSGKETRKMIKDKATGMMDAVKGKAAEANEMVDTVKEKDHESRP